MRLENYIRRHARTYAATWAYRRNPLFYDFEELGGDCTNFVSQCVFAGCCAMNFTENFGWYFLSLANRAAAWTGVPFLYNFLTTNGGVGPYGEETPLSALQIGDIVQLGHADGDFYHSLLVTGQDQRGLLVSAHTDDAYNRRLSSYQYDVSRGIHILGYRTDMPVCNCFESLNSGTALFVCDGEPE